MRKKPRTPAERKKRKADQLARLKKKGWKPPKGSK